MKKIAYVINSIKKNGPSNVILNLIDELNQNQYKIYLITLFDEDDDIIIERLKKNNIKIKQFKMTSRLYSIFFAEKSFYHYIKQEKINILHSHGFIPDIISARLYSKKLLRISTIHNNMFEDYNDEYGELKGKIYSLIHLYFLKRLDYCIGCSESVYNSIKNNLKNATYIRNGIEKQILNGSCISRSDLNIPEYATIFIYVGRIDKRKNVKFLVDKFTRYHNNDEYLLILGSGEEYNKCLQVSDNHTKMLGFIDNPSAYYYISDIYISASKSEGMSISVLEAMDYGLGLFLSNISSHKEIFSIANDIYVGELFNEKTFVESFVKLRKNKWRINRESIRGIKEKELSIRVMTSKYESYYKLG